MLQTLNFYAGGRTINAAATFFRYESGSAAGADEAIRVRADGNDLGLYYPGDAVELPMQAQTWEITPVSGITTGVVRLGIGRVASARLVGTVSVIDQSADKTMAGNQFYGSCQIAATAGGSVAVLQAVGGGGKRVIVKRVAVSSATAGAVLIFHGSAMGSLGDANIPIRSKLVNGAVSSSARMLAASIAGTVPSAGEVSGTYGVARIYVPANTLTPIPLDTPIVLSGTAVLGVNAETANRDLVVYFDVEEK